MRKFTHTFPLGLGNKQEFHAHSRGWGGGEREIDYPRERNPKQNDVNSLHMCFAMLGTKEENERYQIRDPSFI